MKWIKRDYKVRNFHQQNGTNLIFELSNKGERGILVPKVERNC